MCKSAVTLTKGSFSLNDIKQCKKKCEQRNECLAILYKPRECVLKNKACRYAELVDANSWTDIAKLGNVISRSIIFHYIEFGKLPHFRCLYTYTETLRGFWNMSFTN